MYTNAYEMNISIVCTEYVIIYLVISTLPCFIQLILEQHWFEQHRSTYMQILLQQIQWDLHLSRVCLCGFNQPLMERSIFSFPTRNQNTVFNFRTAGWLTHTHFKVEDNEPGEYMTHNEVPVAPCVYNSLDFFQNYI